MSTSTDYLLIWKCYEKYNLYTLNFEISIKGIVSVVLAPRIELCSWVIMWQNVNLYLVC